jgi:hypothetical protein
MAGGNWTEFEEFVAACGPRLLRSAWFLTGDRHLAEDLLQSALARVWPKWGRIAEENPEAYVVPDRRRLPRHRAVGSARHAVPRGQAHAGRGAHVPRRDRHPGVRRPAPRVPRADHQPRGGPPHRPRP